MNALAVQNPRHKCDLGNRNDSETNKKITEDNMTVIINIILRLYYIFVGVHYNLHSKSKKHSVKIKRCGWNEMVEL